MITVSPSPSSTQRRVPAPCWTPEETIALIKAYRDKWYSVNRGNLRSADWDAVAATIAESSTANLPKSSIQCRHKIEKLRKRYRMEKQRCLNFPGRSCSSWNLFPLLDSMAIGSVGVKREQDIDKGNDIGDGFGLKTIGDRYLVTPTRYSNHVDPDLEPYLDLDPDLAYKARKYNKVDEDSGTYFDSDYELGSGFGVKPLGDKNSVSVAHRGRGDGEFEANVDFSCDYGGGLGVKMEKPEVGGAVGTGAGFLVKNLRARNSVLSMFKPKIYEKSDCGAFLAQTTGDRNLMPTGLKQRNYGKISGKSSVNFGDANDHINHRIERRDEFGKHVINESIYVVPLGSRPNNGCKIDRSSKAGVDSNILNGQGNVKMSSICGKVKRVDPVDEVVSSIKSFTEGYVETEKKKMEMLMEIEKMRMETELKHNQMIHKMQQQIVDAFAEVMLEKKNNNKKRKKVEVMSQSLKGNGDSQAAVTTDSESIDKSGIVKENGEGGFT